MIEWTFLNRMLSRLGFDQPFVKLIMLCVFTISYLFLLNGSPFGSLSPFRGTNQGDPLSPYFFFFIICVEAFSQMVEKAMAQNCLRGVYIALSALSYLELIFC